jgi:ectoine hydroxylase-related dioxygenase (phytanoyl-CoA dioxygenase family)
MADTAPVNLTDEQVRCFQTEGFLSLGRLTTDDELAWLRDVYNAVVKEKTGCSPDELARVIGRHGPLSLVTIVSPEGIAPVLKNTLFLRNARKAVARLLAVEETRLLSGWRIFCKPPRGGETPWHQDAAYRPPPHSGASVWMPLDPATDESSCLSYIKRSHKGEIRSHHFFHDHLTTDDVDLSQSVTCPLAAGEALAHHCRTLHYAGPNKTERPRRALVVVCQVVADCQKMTESSETKK